ncbi:prepilin peptidase [Ruminococcus sp. OA3]|uniref:prepilin peptidase n=1 Tax=Ruminococcus sp. OA3 TaxID=2914164 RepID=UPI001F06CC29|nr:A24 family peptidase [Ruminococcus sp. OA3]MCH1983051.1 prepilin peptidase [Ruminococcus sp. OA3]
MLLILCEGFLWALLFTLGACIFSFLNVIIYRVPRGMSFVRGHSACPACGQRLRAKDLIPIFSCLSLKGKCRYCGETIGTRDTWTELLGGGLAILSFYQYENCGTAATVFAFFCVLTVVAFLDLDTMEIEDGCSVAIVAVAILSVFTMPGLPIISRLTGALAVSVPMLILTLLVPGAFGGGDIKLMAASGLFLGWKLTLVSMAIAVLSGGIYGIFLLAAKKKERKDHFAFGPFLCLGMALGLLYGQPLIDWYLGMLLY